MKRLLLIAPFFYLLPGCSYSGSNSIYITNPSDFERKDEAIVIQRTKLDGAKDGLVPVLKNTEGVYYIPCQVDDTDNDGEWDELAFVYTLKVNETAQINIEWIEKNKYPTFVARTNVRYGKYNKSTRQIESLNTDMHGRENLARSGDPQNPYPYQMDGPAWENDKMGFRHYFDGRNCRDVFGKKTTDMVLDTVGIMKNGHPGDTYHVMSDWGRDIMSAAGSFGLGGLAVQLPDTTIRLGVTLDKQTDNVDSTRYTLLYKGPVRSSFRLDFYGWSIGDKKIDLKWEVCIWAGKYGYENRITTSKLPLNAVLITGIVSNFNNMSIEIKKQGGKYITITTHDKQTYDKEWYMGMSLIVPTNNFIQVFDAPATKSEIVKTVCVKMKPCKRNDYQFNTYAAWELADIQFANRNAYIKLIDNYASSMANPIKIKIQ